MKKTLCALTVTVLVLLTYIAGCSMEPSVVSHGKGNGFVRLQFEVDDGVKTVSDTSSRTLLPSSYAFSFYELSFTGNSKGAPNRTITNSNGLNISQLEMVEGDWKLDVKIYLEAARTTQVASAGNISVSVTRGQTASITIPLIFSVIDSGTGTFAWNITASGTAAPNITNIRLTRLDKTAADITKSSLTGTDNSVPSGHYLVTVRLEKDLITSTSGARQILWVDVLHIYPGQTTNLTRTFTQANLNNKISAVWLIVGSNSYAMTQNNLGYWTVQQNMAATDTFAFSLTNPSGTTANNRAWFVPASANTQAVTPANNSMTFLANPSVAADNSRRWTLTNHGVCTFTLNPVSWVFTFTQNVVYPVQSVSLPLDLDLVVGDTATLTPVITPSNATNKNVTWSVVSGSSIISVNSTSGLITATGTGEAVVRVTTQDGSKTADCVVTVSEPVEVIIPYTWRFGTTTPVDGWTAYNSASTATQEETTMKSDANHGNGMTITANQIAGTGTNGMRWMPSQTGWSGGPAGCIQPNSTTLLSQGRRFIKIDNVQGPFSITVNYTSTGATNSGRYAVLYVDGQTINGAATPSSNATSTLRQVEYKYTGSGRVSIQVGANDGIRIFEVILDRKSVESIAITPASADMVTGTTLQLSSVFTPANPTNSSVTWSVTSGGSFVSVSSSGLVTANAVGTANVRVTTADGGKTANCTITVKASAPAGSGYVNVPLTVTDQGTDFTVSAPANTAIYKSGSPTAVEFTITNPVAGHVYTWYVNGNAVPNVNNKLRVQASDYMLGSYNVRLTVKIGNTYWSMPGNNLSFTVMDRN